MRILTPCALVLVVLLGGCRFSLTRDLGTGEIRGRLQFVPAGAGDGAPVAAKDARVELVGSGFTVKSAADGSFVLRAVPAGTHAVRVLFASDGRSYGLLLRGLELGGWAQGQATAGYELGTVLLRTLGTVTGTVTREGAPVAGALVGAQGFGWARTDAAGAYRLFLPDGTFDVAAVYQDPAHGTTQRVSAKAAVPVRGATTVDFQLSDADPTSGSVSGRVLLADGGDASAVTVSLEPSTGEAPIEAGLASGGLWTAPDLPAGIYRLVARANGYAPAHATLLAYPDAEAPQLVLMTDGTAPVACDPATVNAGDPCAGGEAPDLVPPAVSGTRPGPDAVDVPLDAVVRIDFTRTMDPALPAAGAFVVQPATTGALTWSEDGRSLAFDPAEPLLSGTKYTVTLAAGLRDVTGLATADASTWSFTTARVPPTVVASTPIPGAFGVDPTAPLTVTFDQPIDPDSITTGFALEPAANIDATLGADRRTVTYTPTAALPSWTSFRLELSGVRTTSGVAMDAPFTLGFTTAGGGGAAKIVVDFAQGGAADVEPGPSTAVVNAGAGALAAPGPAAAPTTCTDTLPTDGSPIPAGAYAVPSLDLTALSLTVPEGDLDLRVCGDAVITETNVGVEKGSLRLTVGGNLTINGGSGLTELRAGNAIRISLPTRGSTFTTTGRSTLRTRPAWPLDPAQRGGVSVWVNGDAHLAGASLMTSGTGEVDSPPMEIVVAGALDLDNTQLATDVNGMSGPDPATIIRAAGNVLFHSGSEFSKSPSDDTGAGPVEVTAGGALRFFGGGSRWTAIYTYGASDRVALRARGDLEIVDPVMHLGRSGALGSDPPHTIELTSGGSFTCVSPSNGAFLAGPSGVYDAGQRGGLLRARAAGIDLDGCFLWVGGAGATGAAGLISLEAGAGGIHVGGTSSIVPKPGSCGPGGRVRLASSGPVVVDTTRTFPTSGVAGGSSVTDFSGCTPGAGGSVEIGSATAVTATLASAGGQVGAGTGTTPGTVTMGVDTSAASLGAPVVALTESFVAVSRVYDLGAPARVTGLTSEPGTAPTEGVVVVELATAASPAGPWSAWERDPAQLAAARYVKWRATVDRYFFESASLRKLTLALER